MNSRGPRFRKRSDRGGARGARSSSRGRLRRIAPARTELELPQVTLRFAAFAVLAAILLLAVALALGDLANLGRNLLTTFAVALLAYLWFRFWTSYRATNRLRRQAAARPESLFAVPPRVGRAKHVFGRRPLVEEIADKATSDSGLVPS